MAVIDLVSRATGVDPLELEPLYDVIDPDVLDTICRADGFSSLEFTYAGRTVALQAISEGVEITLDGGTQQGTETLGFAETESSD
ncbi:hypothetical protein D8Y22_07020 [Salinadaptatus halalkaliphilus]|uniref:Halobacterial output domain-containing protein n=2 Tax=Salinadaptatus halalkaliphilus TaxID=2419781 RepID=A0A4S3TSG3_9EURY|nr:hypothetical protein D8Y22_07020 [Salinadaptatus halalkaliphilus]